MRLNIDNLPVFCVEVDDLDRYSTLEPSDVGRYFVFICGCIHFVSIDEETGVVNSEEAHKVS